MEANHERTKGVRIIERDTPFALRKMNSILSAGGIRRKVCPAPSFVTITVSVFEQTLRPMEEITVFTRSKRDTPGEKKRETRVVKNYTLHTRGRGKTPRRGGG